MQEEKIKNKIIKAVAENWRTETEYDGKMEIYCFYCGKHQWTSDSDKHEKSCLSVKAREVVNKSN